MVVGLPGSWGRRLAATREEQIILEEGQAGVTLLDASECNLTARRGLRLVVEADRLGARSASGVEWFAAPDTLTVAEAEALARKLSPYRLSATAAGTGAAGGVVHSLPGCPQADPRPS